MPDTASRFPRLTLVDRSNLRMERRETPAHIAGICVAEAGPLLDASGELDLAAIRRRLEARLARAPELRRVIHRPPPLCGPALWVDDPDFSIERHVHAARVGPPGDEASLLETAELILRERLDRTRPLWHLWFLTGLEGGRVGVLFAVHHAIADGLAAIALIASLLDLEPGAAEPPGAAWRPAPAPAAAALLADAMRCRAAAVAAGLRHPLRALGDVAPAVAETVRMLRADRAAPRLSLNAVPRGRRLLRAVHLDLERARAVAHAHGGTVNDALLAVVTGGVRELLAARGELRDGAEVGMSVPVAMERPGGARSLGNAVGAILVRVPAGEPDAARRVERIAAASAAAKAEQRAVYAQGLLAWTAAAGLTVPLIRRQRIVNHFVTNVPGPAQPLYVLGARIEEVLPVTSLAGSVALSFAALSYCGRLDVVAIADADACPEVDVVVAGMSRAWSALAPAISLCA